MDIGTIEDKLKIEIRNLRAGRGCIDKINGMTELKNVMGFTYESDEHRSSCLISVITAFFKDALQADMLLLSLNLLKGYEYIDSVDERRLKYYKDYLSHKKKLSEKNISNTLSKRENNIIKQLAHLIVEAKEKNKLKEIIETAPKGLKLPEPRYQANSPKNETETIPPNTTPTQVEEIVTADDIANDAVSEISKEDKGLMGILNKHKYLKDLPSGIAKGNSKNISKDKKHK